MRRVALEKGWGWRVAQRRTETRGQRGEMTRWNSVGPVRRVARRSDADRRVATRKGRGWCAGRRYDARSCDAKRRGALRIVAQRRTLKISKRMAGAVTSDEMRDVAERRRARRCFKPHSS